MPVFIRMPRSGDAEPYTGLSRAALDILCRPQPLNKFKPPVKSHILRQTSTVRGVRLIDFESLQHYLRQQAAAA